MPELPEVETVKNGLSKHMVGAQIERVLQRRPNLRFPFPDDFCQTLTGATILSLERRAKYLLATLSNDTVLVIHLGMSGRFSILQNNEKAAPLDKTKSGFVSPATSTLEKHDHVVFHLSCDVEIRYNDTRRFGFMLLIDKDKLTSHKFFKDLGAEPLSPDLNLGFLQKCAKGKKTSLKAFLLNQKFIAGLGNIYVCEALFQAGLSPFDPASILALQENTEKTSNLITAIKDILQRAIKAGGSTLKDHRQTDGSLGYFQHSFLVYGRKHQPCSNPKCTSLVSKETQNGRSTFFCPNCQPTQL